MNQHYQERARRIHQTRFSRNKREDWDSSNSNNGFEYEEKYT